MVFGYLKLETFKSRMIFLAGFALLAVVLIMSGARVCNASDNLTELPGQTEGVGTYFEIKDSEYLDLVLESSEEIRIVLESAPRMISLNIDRIDDDVDFDFVDLSLTGLEPNKTYYKYEDSYRNLIVFVANKDGSYSWNQDLIQHHHIWFQEIKGTILLSKDNCETYGVWDSLTLTCTLTESK